MPSVKGMFSFVSEVSSSEGTATIIVSDDSTSDSYILPEGMAVSEEGESDFAVWEIVSEVVTTEGDALSLTEDAKAFPA